MDILTWGRFFWGWFYNRSLHRLEFVASQTPLEPLALLGDKPEISAWEKQLPMPIPWDVEWSRIKLVKSANKVLNQTDPRNHKINELWIPLGLWIMPISSWNWNDQSRNPQPNAKVIWHNGGSQSEALASATRASERSQPLGMKWTATALNGKNDVENIWKRWF